MIFKLTRIETNWSSEYVNKERKVCVCACVWSGLYRQRKKEKGC
jgi:hypothetical protein